MTANNNSHPPRRPIGTRRVIVLGDQDTADSGDLLRDQATQQSAVIAEIHAFERGEAISRQDLGDVEAVVAALGRAISIPADVWVPFPIEDLGLEPHVRRLDLALRRHGRALLLGHRLVPCPPDGHSAIDRALRAEVNAVDDLGNAALAAAGTVILGAEIQVALANSAAAFTDSASQQDKTLLARLEEERGSSPSIPSASAPWRQRQARLKVFASWLVDHCGLTQAEAAKTINSTGHRTPQGRLFQQATVSMLLRGRYGGRSAA